MCAWTLKSICAPLQGFDWQEIKQRHDHLCDVPIETTGEGAVDVLLGLDAAALMIPLEVRRGGAMEPYAERTQLGWVMAGSVQTPSRGGTEKLVCQARVSEAEDDTFGQATPVLMDSSGLQKLLPRRRHWYAQ